VLINDLLDVSHRRGDVQAGVAPRRAAGVVRHLVGQSRPLAAHGIAFEAHVSDCGITLGDPDRLTGARRPGVRCLKFTPAGGVPCAARSAVMRVVTVRDTGEGIGPQFLHASSIASGK
jgi:hypothetical protein